MAAHKAVFQALASDFLMDAAFCASHVCNQGALLHTAVLIALLASNHPLGVLFAAIAFAALEVGANSMQRQMGVPSAIVNILVGLIVLLILGRELFYRKRKEEKPC